MIAMRLMFIFKARSFLNRIEIERFLSLFTDPMARISNRLPGNTILLWEIWNKIHHRHANQKARVHHRGSLPTGNQHLEIYLGQISLHFQLVVHEMISS